jgi:hypothetical protein
MSRWPVLNPDQQNELLGALTALVVAEQQPDWREVLIDYRHLGRLTDGAVGALEPSGDYRLWEPPVEVWRMLQRLRGGMYRDGEGTWFSARLTITPPSRFAVQYNWRNKPSFPAWPDAEQFVVEQERFPRGTAYMPDWFRESLPVH